MAKFYSYKCKKCGYEVHTEPQGTKINYHPSPFINLFSYLCGVRLAEEAVCEHFIPLPAHRSPLIAQPSTLIAKR